MTAPAVADEILEALNSCKRPGMHELAHWLQHETDFFTAPASTRFHGNYEGGLAAHCLNVYDALSVINEQFAEEDAIKDPDSIVIVSLLHDLCKTNYYVEDDDPASSAQMNYVNDLLEASGQTIPPSNRTKSYVSKVIETLKNDPENEIPAFSRNYKVKEELPLGHGEKSIFLISQFIQLTEEEALAIRWHLGMHEPGTHFHYPSGVAMQQAIRENKLVPMMISADYLATWMVDVTI